MLRREDLKGKGVISHFSPYIETEADRLNELIPTAILSWKDAILAFNIRKIQEQIKEAAKAGDLAKMQELLTAQNNLKSLQQQFAKLLGDRVIIP